MNKLIRVAPDLSRLGLIMILLVLLAAILLICIFCLVVLFTTNPEPLLYPLGALT